MARIEVSEGWLEGLIETNKYGGKLCSFKGIPYAEPPLGDLRFKAPQPKKPWKGVRMAKEHGPISYQFDMYITKRNEGSEDCLYLNVYTPELKPTNPLPVMFFIHGGGYTSGSGNDDMYGPEFLVKHNVLLVTFNYRLGALGFLCLHTKDIPGNAGMKDQVAALRWVRSNISKFGGDPENVTIFGESAGGGSVSYHCLSKMSKGLFKRAIIQSGCATSWLPNVLFPQERAFALAKDLGCTSSDKTEAYNFLKSISVENLINKDTKLTLVESIKQYITSSFGVVKEKEFIGVERFFIEDVYDAIRNGVHEGIDIMNGYTEDEGIIFLAGRRDLSKLFIQANNHLDYFVPKPIETNCPTSLQLEVGGRMRNHYFQNKVISNETLDKFLKFVSADIFIYPAILFQKTIAKLNRNKLYLYKFTCKSERNIFTRLIGVSDKFPEGKVVCHGDDLLYVFPFKAVEKNVDVNSKAFELIEKITRLWMNFAKNGDPTPDGSSGEKWLPYTLEDEYYMDIGQELKGGQSPDAEEVEFWNNIYKKFYPHMSIQ